MTDSQQQREAESPPGNATAASKASQKPATLTRIGTARPKRKQAVTIGINENSKSVRRYGPVHDLQRWLPSGGSVSKGQGRVLQLGGWL